MSNNTIGPAYAEFDALRSDFLKTKKVSSFFSGMIALLETEGGQQIRSSIVSEYNHQSARCSDANAAGFAACAAKYGFPVKLER